jgi:hypothetical protein
VLIYRSISIFYSNMINISNQEALFNNIGRRLPKPLMVYAIGGTAMMLRGLKGETLDIDLVFCKDSDRNKFIETLHLIGFRKDEKRVIETYGLKKNTPEMFRLQSDEFVLDLFLNKIVSSVFSEGMKQRARETHEFGTNLIIKVAGPNDVLIMKGVTGRTKDDKDIISIINNSHVDWNIVAEEAEEQVRLGNKLAIVGLGEKLEKLHNQKKIIIPKVILDKLWKLFNRQVKEKKKRGAQPQF